MRSANTGDALDRNSPLAGTKADRRQRPVPAWIGLALPPRWGRTRTVAIAALGARWNCSPRLCRQTIATVADAARLMPQLDADGNRARPRQPT